MKAKVAMILATAQKHRFHKAALTLTAHREPFAISIVDTEKKTTMWERTKGFPYSSKGGEMDNSATEDVCDQADIGR